MIALLFAGMDFNHDHVIDETVLTDGMTREWQAIGTKTVSAPSLAEWSAHALGDADALPNHITFDRNLDGQATEVELRVRLTSKFSQLDANHDQALTRAEMLRHAPTRSRPRSTSVDGQRPSGGGDGDGGRPPC